MAWQNNIVITGTPGSFIEADGIQNQAVIDPADQQWSNGGPDYIFDAAEWRFPGQLSNTIFLYDLDWAPNPLPALAVVQEITVRFSRFLLSGLFDDADVRDGGVIPSLPQTANPSLPLPSNRNYSPFAEWIGAMEDQRAAVQILSDFQEGEQTPSNADLMEGGFGFGYFMISATGRMKGVNGQVRQELRNPQIDIKYSLEV